jgi:DNA invertase Pin-like site-specific DNA recombinase
MKPEKVGIYARVSTLDKGQDVKLQLSDLRTYADARGWKVFKEYVDVGQSGSKEQRPAFSQLMEDARKRRIDIILVWRLDRFGRFLKHLVVSLDEIVDKQSGFRWLLLFDVQVNSLYIQLIQK